MDSMIEKICAMQLKEEDFPFGKPDKAKMDREWELYYTLIESLPTEQKELFLEYTELVAERGQKERMEACKKGFKIAIQLTVDIMEK